MTNGSACPRTGQVRRFFNSIRLSEIFQRPAQAERDLTKTYISSMPQNTRRTGGQASATFLRGLFTGANQNFNLASGFTYPAVSIPKQLVGVPSLGGLAETYPEIQNLLLDEGPIITQTMLVTGTAWRWPRWSDRLTRLVWEAIPDESIGSQGIETDPDTGEIICIRTDEQVEFNGPEFRQKYARRKRAITRDSVTEEWAGDIRKLSQYKNPFGIMPIPFGHDCWENEWRGNSVYGRVIRLIADNHDIKKNRDEILAQFRPKMIQTSPMVERWMMNNKKFTAQGNNGQQYYNPFEADFVINGEGEATTYLNIGSDATAQHTAAILANEKEIMISSGVPELLWGGLATGNYASTESQIVGAVNYIKEIQREMSRAYKVLLNGSAEILSFMRFGSAERIEVKWNSLDMTSAEQRSRIIGGYASAMSAMLGNGSISAEGAVYFTKLMFEDYPAEDAQAYLDGINKMLADHTSHIGETLMDMGDIGGGEI